MYFCAMKKIKNNELKNNFLRLIQKEVADFSKSISTAQGDWVVKGFIDIAKNIYTISIDTKVISKIMELLIFPSICAFAERNKFKIILSYVGHFVLGIIYTRSDDAADERKIYGLDDLQNITSVVKDFNFFVQEKYKIAIDRPGSGNTKNIGGVTNIEQLKNGDGPFAKLGEDVFNDYWMYYLTKDMAQAAELPNPLYTNLKQYKEFKNIE